MKPEWRNRIRSVVHVDGTARPQIVRKECNPLYYDIIKDFENRTGIPVLINTSLNVHEEPIVNTPQECLKTANELCPKGDAVHDVQAGYLCATQLAQVARIPATWESDRRYTIQRRDLRQSSLTTR